MATTILQLDPWKKPSNLLIPEMAQRIEHYAALHQPDAASTEYAGSLIGRLWVGDRRVLILALIEPDSAKLVGHVLATHEPSGIGMISQASDDSGITATLRMAVDHATAWLTSLGLTKVMLACPPKQGKKWESLGFKPYRQVLMLSLAATSKADDASPDPQP